MHKICDWLSHIDRPYYCDILGLNLEWQMWINQSVSQSIGWLFSWAVHNNRKTSPKIPCVFVFQKVISVELGSLTTISIYHDFVSLNDEPIHLLKDETHFKLSEELWILANKHVLGNFAIIWSEILFICVDSQKSL